MNLQVSQSKNEIFIFTGGSQYGTWPEPTIYNGFVVFVVDFKGQLLREKSFDRGETMDNSFSVTGCSKCLTLSPDDSLIVGAGVFGSAVMGDPMLFTIHAGTLEPDLVKKFSGIEFKAVTAAPDNNRFILAGKAKTGTERLLLLCYERNSGIIWKKEIASSNATNDGANVLSFGSLD